MKRVLIPYDDFDSSRRALDYALDPAEVPANVALHLINVQPWPPAYGEYMTPNFITEVHEAMMGCGRQILAPAVKRLEAACREHTAEAQLGEIAHLIVERATALKCDHIIMGRRGLSAVKGLLLGSIATRVLHLADVPVTLLG